MRPDESFLGQPIRSLQTMLRFIAQSEADSSQVIPDGIYGPETSRTVSQFQRRHGLSVTGVTDQNTWDAIHAQYELALIEHGDAHPLHITIDAGAVFSPGDTHPHIRVAQGMLQALSDAYYSIGDLEITGTWDDPSGDALSVFQQLSGLPMTGTLDKHTWKHLVLHYSLATDLLNRNTE